MVDHERVFMYICTTEGLHGNHVRQGYKEKYWLVGGMPSISGIDNQSHWRLSSNIFMTQLRSYSSTNTLETFGQGAIAICHARECQRKIEMNSWRLQIKELEVCPQSLWEWDGRLYSTYIMYLYLN